MKREFLEGDEKKKEEILRQTIQKVQVFHETAQTAKILA
jgi:hypothetical protein